MLYIYSSLFFFSFPRYLKSYTHQFSFFLSFFLGNSI